MVSQIFTDGELILYLRNSNELINCINRIKNIKYENEYEETKKIINEFEIKLLKKERKQKLMKLNGYNS